MKYERNVKKEGRALEEWKAKQASWVNNKEDGASLSSNDWVENSQSLKKSMVK